jgi:hypothetical protein
MEDAVIAAAHFLMQQRLIGLDSGVSGCLMTCNGKCESINKELQIETCKLPVRDDLRKTG